MRRQEGRVMRSLPIHTAEHHRRLASHAILALAFAALLVALSAAPAAALSFAPARHFAAGQGPCALAVADLNGDEKPDLVVADGKRSTVRTFIGNGRGGFTVTGPFATGATPTSLAVGDLDGDGSLDVVTGNGADGTVSLLFGTGSGGFSARTDFVVGPPRLLPGLYQTGVSICDFDRDGLGDIVVCGQPVEGPPYSEAAVLMGTGSRGFAPPLRVPTPKTRATPCAATSTAMIIPTSWRPWSTRTRSAPASCSATVQGTSPP